MADRTGSKSLGTSGSVALGAVAGLMLAAYVGLPGGWGALAGGVLAYLVVCGRFPWRPCPKCGGGSTNRDTEQNYRVKRTCWVCRGQRWPRPGTRLLMVFGHSPRA